MLRFRNSSYLFVCFLLIITECTIASEKSPSPQVEIQMAWQQFIEAWETGDAEACASFYHDDALNIPPGFQIFSGKDAITSFYAMLFDENQSSKYTHNTESLSFSGDLAIEHANFTVDWVNNSGAEWTFNARALVHWQKNDEGNWLIKNFLFNNPP
jgi:uncharacterized protein (TIGR02246 family)